MIFDISRTSNCAHKVPPCKEAYLSENPEWPNKDFKQWLIEINSLEELINLSKSEDDELVINSNGNHLPSIEIYDGYRE